MQKFYGVIGFTPIVQNSRHAIVAVGGKGAWLIVYLVISEVPHVTRSWL